MPLIKCPDCGSQISKSAKSCPSCGRPMQGEVSGCGACLLLVFYGALVVLGLLGLLFAWGLMKGGDSAQLKRIHDSYSEYAFTKVNDSRSDNNHFLEDHELLFNGDGLKLWRRPCRS